MRKEFIKLLEGYSTERALRLEKKLITGAVVARYGTREETTFEDGSKELVIRYDEEFVGKSGAFGYINYDSIISHEREYMILDSTGNDRESGAKYEGTKHIDLNSLITDDFYVHGKKTKILNDIISSIFYNTNPLSRS